MASKLKNKKKAIILVALLGLILVVLVRSCIQGLRKNVEEENGSYFRQQFVMCVEELRMALSLLTVKFLHFFISWWLQLRYLPALFPAPWTMSMSFSVAFTRSISSLPDNPLQ